MSSERVCPFNMIMIDYSSDHGDKSSSDMDSGSRASTGNISPSSSPTGDRAGASTGNISPSNSSSSDRAGTSTGNISPSSSSTSDRAEFPDTSHGPLATGSPYGSEDDQPVGMFVSETAAHTVMTHLDDLAKTFVARSPESADAVMIFTYTDAGEKWKTSADRPAIIIPSKLLPPNPSIHSLEGDKYSDDFVDFIMIHLVVKIKKLELAEPFISTVDFGANQNGQEIDFVVSRHIHEAPLYLHTCHLLSSWNNPSLSTVSVPARYHHLSSSGGNCSFETRLFLECNQTDNCSAKSGDADRSSDDDEELWVPREPIASRLDEKLRANLNENMKMFISWWRTKKEPVASVFTSNSEWWAAGTNTMIEMKGFWRQDEGRSHSFCDIANYLLELAEQENVERLNVSCLEAEYQGVSEWHLVLSLRGEPALSYLENCTIKSDLDVEGVYRYLNPITAASSTNIYIRATRRLGIDL